jgi:hypothetical protein
MNDTSHASVTPIRPSGRAEAVTSEVKRNARRGSFRQAARSGRPSSLVPRWMAPSLVVLVLTAAAAPVSSAALGSLALDGALGEHVRVGPQPSRPTIVFFMSQRAADECAAFGRKVDEEMLEADVESLAIVDVRRYAGWMRTAATYQLRKSAEEALAHRRERRRAHGRDASDEVVRRWHLIGDFDGALFARFGVAPDLAHPLAFVIDKRGALPALRRC